MKTDRKLLELAALAAGLVYEHPGLAYPAEFREQVATWHPVTSGCDQFERIPLAEWNPLADDGDALRLAVKLNLIVECMKGQSAARTFDSRYGGACDFPKAQPDGCKRPYAPDQYAATCRAIVIAAASIGSALLAAKEEPNV